MRTAEKQQLCAAAETVLAEKVEALLDGYDPKSVPEFSAQFKERMSEIANRTTRHIGRRIAVIFFAVLLGFSFFLSTNAPARASVSGWVKSLYEEYIQHIFTGNKQVTNEVPQNALELNWVPDGYELLDKVDNEMLFVVFYINSETNHVLKYECVYNENAEKFTVSADTRTEEIKINKTQATLVMNQNETNTNLIFWTDSSGRIYYVSGNLQKHELIKIAEKQLF